MVTTIAAPTTIAAVVKPILWIKITQRGEKITPPMLPPLNATPSANGRLETNRPFSDCQAVYKGLDLVGGEDIRGGFALRSLTHQTDWIVIEELISACMIE